MTVAIRRPGDDRRQRQRQLDAPQHLARRQAHARAPPRAPRRAPRAAPRACCGRGSAACRRRARSRRSSRVRPGERHEQLEQRQRGDRVEDAGDERDRRLEPAAAVGDQRQRERDREADRRPRSASARCAARSAGRSTSPQLSLTQSQQKPLFSRTHESSPPPKSGITGSSCLGEDHAARLPATQRRSGRSRRRRARARRRRRRARSGRRRRAAQRQRVAQRRRPSAMRGVRRRARARRRHSQVELAHAGQRQALERAVGARRTARRTRRPGAARISSGVRVLREHAALAQDRDAVAHLDRLVDVVGDEHDGLADLAPAGAGTRPAGARG